MSDAESEFVKARFRGRRYQNGVLPLSALPELLSYERILTELARWEYKEEHPERRRVPRNFTKHFSLGIDGVEDGSAVACLVRPTDGLPFREEDYFTRARNLFSDAIAGIDSAVAKLKTAPRSVLQLMALFGRTLESDDSISFEHLGKNIATYDLKRRRAMQQELHAEYEESFVDIGLLTGISKGATKKIDFQLSDGKTFSGNINSANVDSELTLHYSDESRNYVRVAGTSLHHANGELKSLNVDEVAFLGPIRPDFERHLEKLHLLEAGWLDGEGKRITPTALREGLNVLRQLVWDEERIAPRVYPTPEGGIQAEWSSRLGEVILEVEPNGDFFAHVIEPDGQTEHEMSQPTSGVGEILTFVGSYLEERNT